MKIPVHKPGRSNHGKRLALGLLVLAGCLVSSPAVPLDWFLFQGIADAELYDTDTGSSLLTRNHGDIAALGRLQLWTAFQLSPSLQFFAQGQAEVDNFTGSSEIRSNFEQIAVRYARQSTPWISIEAGKILSSLATYSERRLSTKNPLIGQPYLYTNGYPLGAKLSGFSGWLDYQVALIEPSGNGADYQGIEPESVFRPELGLGVTPFTGLRIGLTWTRGPYLNDQVGHYLPPGGDWRGYDQRVMGFDYQFSRGFLEFNGSFLRTRHEVPYGETTDDTSYFLELKYTWTPRLYGAVRYQGVEASYVEYSRYRYWYSEKRRFNSLEVGLGYRFSPDVLLKLAYESDHWDNPDEYYASNARGHALGLQLSWAFDLVSLFADEL